MHSAVATTWTKGDIVTVFFICIEEEDIMDVAYADSENELEYASAIKIKQFSNKCSLYARHTIAIEFPAGKAHRFYFHHFG